ncbi:hypothetical protein P175DRAFT_0509807 [Aspergillus ochraceoroseus IBT 24754]|uniref:Expansin-like EG45 domain-containing protein n=2 Tax=Aspergillus ochraceoroseus TaxID=138278 RepID=A0A2T5LU45_9EURO|nr:uncharacterized protein P175DRAFT_0509807 [Aspergillus ochraceoroseus IBT 24754]KKK17964.1 hypothetical protein AOCH_003036 [Aspergillus ochraceoroseus]PTU19804.1 hypothetical protein P175DRAFT_0509807 [Aspergillus ochraceoroseus IBT 24754]
MKYQRLGSLALAALGASTAVSASPLVQREDNGQCPPGYSMSVYYITVTAEPTIVSTAAVESSFTPSTTSTSTSTAISTITSTTTSTTTSTSTSTSTSTTVVVSTTAAGLIEAIPLVSTSTADVSAVETSTTSSIAAEETAAVRVASSETSTATSTTTLAATTATTTTATTQAQSTATTKAIAAAVDTTSTSSGTVNSGRATFYGGNVSGGTCSFTGYTIPSGLFGTALSGERWDNAAECGACVSVTGPNGNTIKAMIVDKCPECESNHLDLFQNAFAELADISKGIIPIKWSYVSCDIDTPLILKNKEGTSPYWFSMQVVNANEAITAFEVSTDSGSTWQSTTRSFYNFFENSSGFHTDTVDVRITGESGKKITVKNVGCASGSTITTATNF